MVSEANRQTAPRRAVKWPTDSGSVEPPAERIYAYGFDPPGRPMCSCCYTNPVSVEVL